MTQLAGLCKPSHSAACIFGSRVRNGIARLGTCIYTSHAFISRFHVPVVPVILKGSLWLLRLFPTERVNLSVLASH